MLANNARDLTDPFCALSRADACEYTRLQESFIRTQNAHVRDRRVSSFKQEIDSIIRFVDSRPEDRELRALATGLVRTGSYLCVNSQRLKNFVRRCKSSINNGFQHLGFDSVKSRTRSNSCLAAALPSIATQSNLGRQWTVRCIDQIVLERPKSAAPVIRNPLPMPILNAKEPLPVPKIDTSRYKQSSGSPPVFETQQTLELDLETQQIQNDPFFSSWEQQNEFALAPSSLGNEFQNFGDPMPDTGYAAGELFSDENFVLQI